LCYFSLFCFVSMNVDLHYRNRLGCGRHCGLIPPYQPSLLRYHYNDNAKKYKLHPLQFLDSKLLDVNQIPHGTWSDVSSRGWSWSTDHLPLFVMARNYTIWHRNARRGAPSGIVVELSILVYSHQLPDCQVSWISVNVNEKRRNLLDSLRREGFNKINQFLQNFQKGCKDGSQQLLWLDSCYPEITKRTELSVLNKEK
jgi:hypothetical protein